MWVMRPYILLFVITSSLRLVTSSDVVNPDSSDDVSVHVSENTGIGTVVADLKRLYGLPNSVGNFEILTEQILLEKREDKKLLEVEMSSGLVKVHRMIDRDVMCAEVEPCMIQLKAFVSGLQRLLNLDIIIDDVNDNPPVFPSPSFKINISENVQVGSVIRLNDFLAQDKDLGQNGEITYSISPSPYFTLEEYNDDAGEKRLRLKVDQLLDYEDKSLQRLQEIILYARDQGDPPLSGYAHIIIRIIDHNDNDPVFEKQKYFVNLPENLFPGHLVTRVFAQDADFENSGSLRYFLSRRNKAIASRLLKVNHVTGDITLRETLDREVHDKLRVLIEARDSGSTNQRVGRTWLQINVNDINDNPPQIKIKYLLPFHRSTIYLSENATAGTYLAYVSATDPDYGKNGKVKIFVASITSENKGGETSLQNTFALSKNRFLALNRSVDREVLDNYDIIIKACDHGTPAECSTENINIRLLDVNDHGPVFRQSIVRLVLPEDTEVGTRLIQVQAKDDDVLNPPALYLDDREEILSSPYGEIMYHALDGDGTFAVDSRTGEITLAQALDRESTSSYEVTIRAKDGGRQNALQSTSKLQVSVSDVNDNKPIFTFPKLHDVLYATILRDDVIITVQAIDYDSGANGTVTYRILTEDGVDKSRDAAGSLFVIDDVTGELRLNLSNSKLNQSLGLHRIVVEAADLGIKPLHSTHAIDIDITDLVTLPSETERPGLLTSTTYFIVMVTSVTILLMLVVGGLISWRCRRSKKTNRTPTMKQEKTTNSQCGSIVKISSEDCKYNTLPYDCVKGEINQDATDCNIRIPYVEAKNNSMKKADAATASKFPSDEVKNPNLEADFKRRYASFMTSPHDADSGRGDSDPDAPGSDVTIDDGRQANIPSQDLSSRCTEQCLLLGHSDACWMPQDDQSAAAVMTSLPPYEQTHFGPSLYSYLAPTSPSASNYDRSNLDIIPESTQHVRNHWGYPANELSSIYSDVIMTQQKLMMQSPKGKMDYLRPSPQSCISTPSTFKPSYKDINIGTTSTSPHRSKHPPPPIEHPHLVRSASADLLTKKSTSSSRISLDHPTSTDRKIQEKKHPKKFSMKETQDIVEGIEKLLD